MKEKVTEQDSRYENLEQMSLANLLRHINDEDKTVPSAIEKVLDKIEKVAVAASEKMKSGGRMFYIGAGTSGRLGIVDASECPPTFGIEQGRVVGIIAGGDSAIRKAVEFAEDDPEAGWKDLQSQAISSKDIVIGIAASGTTPYVAGALKRCRENGITTAAIVCNTGSPVAANADFPVEVVVGPEFVTGSTRMKSGTAQKLILNMISTAVMISLGRVKGNKMVDMQLTNNKLIDRGIKMLMNTLGVDEKKADELLRQHGSVRKALAAEKSS